MLYPSKTEGGCLVEPGPHRQHPTLDLLPPWYLGHGSLFNCTLQAVWTLFCTCESHHVNKRCLVTPVDESLPWGWWLAVKQVSRYISIFGGQQQQAVTPGLRDPQDLAGEMWHSTFCHFGSKPPSPQGFWKWLQSLVALYAQTDHCPSKFSSHKAQAERTPPYPPSHKLTETLGKGVKGMLGWGEHGQEVSARWSLWVQGHCQLGALRVDWPGKRGEASFFPDPCLANRQPGAPFSCPIRIRCRNAPQ